MYERWDVKGLLQSAFLSHTQLFPGLCSQCTTPSCLHPQFRFCWWSPATSVHLRTHTDRPIWAPACVFLCLRVSEIWLKGSPAPKLGDCSPRYCSPSHWHLGSFRDIRAVLTVNKFPLGETKLNGELSGNGGNRTTILSFPTSLGSSSSSSFL